MDDGGGSDNDDTREDPPNGPLPEEGGEPARPDYAAVVEHGSDAVRRYALVEDPLPVQDGDDAGRKFDPEIVIDRAVKTGYEDDLRTFIENPDLFWKPINDIDVKYLAWSAEAAKRGHLSIIKVLWKLFESRHTGQNDLYRDDQLRKIVYKAARHGQLDVLCWVWRHSTMDKLKHCRPATFKIGPLAAVRGGSLAALRWFDANGFSLSTDHINVAIERGYADIVKWYFENSTPQRKTEWITRHKVWYGGMLRQHKVDRNVQAAMIVNSVIVPRPYSATGVSGANRYTRWKRPSNDRSWAPRRPSSQRQQHWG